jgi:sec-independent protein translocase protein TatB
MFEVGFSELVLLFVIGLLVLGPEKLPKVARTLGGLTRKARSSWLNLKRSIEAEINAGELKAPLKNIQNEFKSAANQINAGLDSIRQPLTPSTPAASVPPTQPATSKQPVSSEPSSQHDQQ